MWYLMIIDLWVDPEAIGSVLSWIVGIILVVVVAFLFSLIPAVCFDGEASVIGFLIGLVIAGYVFLAEKSWLDRFFSGLTSLTFSIIEIVIVAFITNIIIIMYRHLKDWRDERNLEMEWDY